MMDKAILQAMKQKVPLYSVTASVPGGATYRETFVFADGFLRKIDAMAEAIPPEGRCPIRLQLIGTHVARARALLQRNPLDFAELQKAEFLPDQAAYRCPCHPEQAEGYGWFYPFAESKTAPEALLAWDAAMHADGARTVLRFDGRVETLSDAGFRQELAAQQHASVAGLKKALEGAARWTGGKGEKSPPKTRRREVLDTLLAACEAAR
jgi:hypothetical protein